MLGEFVAIDFETANGNMLSATEVGAVKIRDGVVVDEFHRYVKLPTGIEWPLIRGKRLEFANWMAGENVQKAYQMSKKHGVTWDEIGKDFQAFAGENELVAHNASFDRSVLYTLNDFCNIEYFPPFWCSCNNAKTILKDAKESGDLASFKLRDLAIYFELTNAQEYQNDGHSALFDAKLCGLLMTKLDDLAPLKPMGIPNDKKFRSRFLNDVKASEDVFNERVEALLLELETPAEMSFLSYGYISENDKQISIADSEKYGFKDVITETERQLGSTNYARTMDEVLEIIDKFGKMRENGEIDLPTDGIVVKCADDYEISKIMGSTAHHPSSQIAFKYPPLSAKSTVQNIEIGVGRTGRLSFRAQIDPVNLDGVNIEYATLHNFDWMSKKDIRIGSKITVVRANDVIPYVSAVLSNPEGTKIYPEPDVCPLCNAKIDKSTLLYRCPNEECESRGESALKTALSRKYLNVEYLSGETIDDLISAGLVGDLGDIFTLTLEQLSTLKIGEKSTETKKFELAEIYNEGYDMNRYFGDIRAQKVYDSIQKAKKAPLHKVLAALNIRLLGLEVAKNLVRELKTIDKMLEANFDELSAVDLVSVKRAEIIMQGLQNRRPLIEKLRSAGVEALQVKSSVQSAEANDADNDLPLENEIIVLSGSFPGMSRDDARDFLEGKGAETSGSVSSKTTIVIADPGSSSSKVVKAKSLGIKVIAPDEFLASLSE